MTADALLRPDHQAGRNLMRTAVRLLAHGSPITVTELAEAAGGDAADLATAPAGQDVEYDDDRRIVGWGLTLNPRRCMRSLSTVIASTHGARPTP